MQMSKLYLLNAVALNMFQPPLTLKISTVTPEQARELVKNKELVNAIGHDATATAMSAILNMELKANRAQVKMSPGDEALVLALNKRLEEGQVIRTLEELSKVGYTLYYVVVSQ